MPPAGRGFAPVYPAGRALRPVYPAGRALRPVPPAAKGENFGKFFPLDSLSKLSPIFTFWKVQNADMHC